MCLRICYACIHCKYVPDEFDEYDYYNKVCDLDGSSKSPNSICRCDDYVRSRNCVDLSFFDDYLLEEIVL